MKGLINNGLIPLDIPASVQYEYVHHLEKATFGTGKMLLFAGDQKVEHLDKDYYGDGISKADEKPIHLFRIASKSKIGVLATQLGFIARYGNDFKNINYLVKINSKTNLLDKNIADPFSHRWYDIEQIIDFKENSGLSIIGIGYTLYLGSTYEYYMLSEAARLVCNAHKHGLLAILWIYPKGKSISDEKEPQLIAGAAGVGAALGADYIKLNLPQSKTVNPYQYLQHIVKAAGRTKVLISGGPAQDPQDYLSSLYQQITIGGTAGCAVGRNIHQKPTEEAIRLANAMHAIIIEGKNLNEAIRIYNSK